MRHSHPSRRALAAAAVLASLATACGHDDIPAGPRDPVASFSSAAPPALRVSIPAGTGTLSLWPYTGDDFTGTPQDPINLVFSGANPRQIRSALFALSGDRTAFGLPGSAPFDCTWSDAIGDAQTGYSDAGGWVGSAVQLACGDFSPIRFHLRLFQAGALTLGGAHFELHIPGTTNHQVLSWELAEQLVTVDLVRSGLLGAAPTQTALLNAAPTFREIPAEIYNLIPVALRLAIGGPPGDVSAPVGIATDGRATRLVLAATAPAAGGTTQRFMIDWNQVIPRPFCASGPGDYLLVEGPVELRKDVHLTSADALVSEYHATGRLDLTPIDPQTGLPMGEPYEAQVSDQQVTRDDDGGSQVEAIAMQRELPQGVSGRGQLIVRLKVGPGDVTQFDRKVTCHP